MNQIALIIKIATVVCLFVCRSNASELIVFTSLQPTNLEVFLYKSPEAEPEQLTDHPALDYGAVMSPDGKWVVFTSERTGNPELFALELSTRKLHPLTRNIAMDDAADFSPDGRTLVFVSSRDGFADLYTMPFKPRADPDSTVVHRLTHSHSGDFSPEFSPDGKTIVFSSLSMGHHSDSQEEYERSVGWALFKIAADGGQPEPILRISWNYALLGSPEWSADGKRLFFHQGEMDGRNVKILSLHPTRGLEIPEELQPPVEDCFGFLPGPNEEFLLNCLRTENDPKVPAYIRAEEAQNQVLLGPAVDGKYRQLQSPGPEFTATDFSVTGGILAHASVGKEDASQLELGGPLRLPGSERITVLPDREVKVFATPINFPTISPKTGRLFGTKWLWPKGRGMSPIISTALDGTATRSVTKPTGDLPMWGAVVSRDGQWVYYSLGLPQMMAGQVKEHEADLWRVRSDGTGAENLTPGPGFNDALPDVSADGSRIVFRRKNADKNDQHIRVMNADGSGNRRVSQGDGKQNMPGISPDGRTVAYTWAKPGKRDWHIYLQSLDDEAAEPRLLIPEDRLGGLVFDMHPKFSPDGKWIVFVSSRAGMNDDWFLSARRPQPYGEIFVAPVDGHCAPIRLTHDKWEDGPPFWVSLPEAAN